MTSVVYTLIWRMDSPRVKIENKGSRDQKLVPYRTSQRKSRIDPAQSSVPDDTKLTVSNVEHEGMPRTRGSARERGMHRTVRDRVFKTAGNHVNATVIVPPNTMFVKMELVTFFNCTSEKRVRAVDV